MSNRNLDLALRLSADSSRLLGGLSKGESGLRKFGRAAKGEMDALKHAARSVEGRLAQIGLGLSVMATASQSAHLDKDLKQLQLTAAATADEAVRLRKELMDAQIDTGQSADELKGGVDALIAGGLSMAEATATVAPMAETLAVAKTNADALAKAMGVASKQFNIDLSNTTEARLLLDKMVVAGRAGNAELENLPDIFARIGGSAKSSNMSMDQTLALVETLSLVEPSAERLSTLTDSTLRVFTNANYMKAASKATGVKFFDADGSRRDALKVIEEIKGKYDKLGTDRQRFSFINKAFGKTDLDTQRGLKALLDGDALNKLGTIFTDVRDAGGTIGRDLPDAISNAVDQTGRLKGALREAADGFIKPLNDTFSDIVKWGLDSKENGGLGLDGKDILLGGAIGAAGIFGAARYGGKAIRGLAGKFGNLGAGVATGKALEHVTGVQSVFVVNMPDSLGGQSADKSDANDDDKDLLSEAKDKFGSVKDLAEKARELGGGTSGWRGPSMGEISRMGTAEKLSAAGAVVAAGQTGWEIGTWLSDNFISGTKLGDAIGEAVAYAISPFSEEAREAIALNNKPAEVAGNISIHVTSDGQAKVTQLSSEGGLELDVLTGRTGAGR